MTTVRQMIEWLNTLPETAEVECGTEVEHPFVYMTMKAVDIESCWVCDFTAEKYKVHPQVYGRIVVRLHGGES